MDNLMLRDDLVESCIILKDKENSRFQQKSGIFVAGAERFELSTRGFGVAVETTREHRVLPVCLRVYGSQDFPPLRFDALLMLWQIPQPTGEQVSALKNCAAIIKEQSPRTPSRHR
ncbi:MAG: hypothetical protein J1E06_01370 [Acutalibacter sp.]|nr:hypothetical protein [Acutalibacter sp.]